MAEPAREPWIQWVALTTTLLAVFAAISSLKATSYSTKVQIATTKEANQWAYYQSKSIKGYSYALTRDLLMSLKLLEIKNPKAQKFLAAKISEYDAEIGRYDQEKNEVKKGAEEIIKEQEIFKKKNGDFAVAVMLLQLAITCSAVGVLIKKKLLWFVGLILGVWGGFYIGVGFLL
jgi:hypothetical protein